METVSVTTNDRLQEMCGGYGKYDWNSFPPGDVAQIDRINTPQGMFHWGVKAGMGIMGQPRVKEIPYLIRQALGLQDANPMTVWTCYFVVSDGTGQGTRGKPNMKAIFPYAYKVDHTDLIVAEIGCNHEFTGRRIGRCATDWTCTKCGFGQTEDSGD